VPEDVYEVVKHQGKSKPAESAVKLTVYKSSSSEETEAPAQPQTPGTETFEAPVKRETSRKATAETAEDVSDIVKKWSKK
jgi:hypothetical protein